MGDDNKGSDFDGGYSQEWNKEVQSHKEIVLRAIEKCRVELSKDMREGGTFNVPTQKGILPMYFVDQAEVIINSIETLYDLMLWYFDDEAIKKIGEARKNIKDAYKFHYDKYLKREYSQGYKNQAIKSNVITEGIHSVVGSTIMKEFKGYYLEKYRELFRELILLFKRKNELSGKRKISFR